MIELAFVLYALGAWIVYVEDVKGRRRDKLINVLYMIAWPLGSLVSMGATIWYFLCRSGESR